MGREGLEPSTNGLKVRCSNQLSYRPPAEKPKSIAGVLGTYKFFDDSNCSTRAAAAAIPKLAVTITLDP